MRKRRSILVFFVVCLSAVSTYAGLTGDILGTVFDASNAAVADAKITIRSANTGLVRLVTTNQYGEYSAPQLDIGTYQVTVEKTGFRSFTQQAVVRDGEKTRLDVHLQIGAVGSTVTVEASALPTLDVATAQVSESLNSQEVLDLPNGANGTRDPVLYATLSPGTVPVTADNPFLGLGSFNSNGSRGRANNITLDGVTAADISTTGESGAAFTQDDIQEVKIITNNFDAEFGRNSGSQVQLLTKSGTNHFHGEAYDYAQNTFFGNARNYFDTTGKATPIIQDQGGGNFGGPVIKNHTFFYGSFEEDRTRGAGGSVIANVITPAEAATITDPTSAALFKSDGSPTSPTGRLAQTSANLLNQHTWTVRGDQNLRGGKDSLFVKYGQSPSFAISPSLTFVFGNLAGYGASNTATPKDLTIAYTATLSSNVVNDFRFGFGRSNPSFPINSPYPFGPMIQISGLDPFGEAFIIPQGRTQNTFQYADTVSWTKGRHTFKFGADINRYQAPSFFEAEEQGLVAFPSVTAFQMGQPSEFQRYIGNTTRHNFALDAFGFVQDDFRVKSTLTLNLGFRLESSGGVSEENNLITNLDLNNHTPIGALGTGPLGGVDLGGTAFHRNWNPAPRLGFAWNPGLGKFVLRGGYGIAYDFIYQNPITNLRFSPPYVNIVTVTNFTGGNTYAALVAGKAPAEAAATAALGKFDPNQVDFGAFSPVAQNLSNPRNQQWNVGIEYSAPQDTVLKVTYLGTRNDHLQVSQPINHVVPANIPAAPTSLADQNARESEFVTAFQNESGAAFGPINNRLDPRFDSVVQVQSTGTSLYNAFELEAIRRFKNGLTFDANYTWAHSIDDVSDALGVLINDKAALVDPTKPLSFQRSNSQFDVRNRVVLSYDYQIPFARGSEGIKKYLLDGWGTSGIFSAQSGFPATVYAAPVAFADGASINDLLLDGDSVDINGQPTTTLNGNATLLRPVPIGQPQKVDPTTIVSEPLLEQDGTSGRNHLRLAGITDWDIAVNKAFKITESKSFLLRWEAFNVLNKTNLGGYVNSFASPFFNTYTATSTVNRLFQISGKFVF
jgi:Carboxypeptidase regulatory-like domain